MNRRQLRQSGAVVNIAIVVSDDGAAIQSITGGPALASLRATGATPVRTSGGPPPIDATVASPLTAEMTSTEFHPLVVGTGQVKVSTGKPGVLLRYRSSSGDDRSNLVAVE